MKTSTSTTHLSWILTGLFLLNVISIFAGHHAGSAWSTIHNLSGTLILVGAIMHLRLHWTWVRSMIFRRPQNLGGAGRQDRVIDTLLFGIGALCAICGPFALVFPGGALSHLHQMSGMLMGIVIFIHIALHHKWYAATMRRAIEGWSKSFEGRRSEV